MTNGGWSVTAGASEEPRRGTGKVAKKTIAPEMGEADANRAPGSKSSAALQISNLLFANQQQWLAFFLVGFLEAAVWLHIEGER
ncbi:hypothetical protein GGD46_000742 [Rhizobium lusitanum]|uniref:Uncharacterized protein n=1 Tax=Rhizobium lusitanum TaxID=293958 RepID=A0A7X0IM23_9HYPH|nr:hypothetical protein [Rhizobium lusitanum]